MTTFTMAMGANGYLLTCGRRRYWLTEWAEMAPVLAALLAAGAWWAPCVRCQRDICYCLVPVRREG